MAATDAPKPISGLPEAAGVTTAYTVVVVDATGNTAKVTVEDLVADVASGPPGEEGPPGPPGEPGLLAAASEAEALAATNDTKAMTPAKVAVIAEKYDVRRSGVVGGAVDTTAAIQAAIDVVKNTPKGEAFFPPDVYGFTSELLIDTRDTKITGPGNASLKMDRNSAWLVALAEFAAGTAAIRVEPATTGERLEGIEIKGLTITGDPRYLTPGAPDLKYLPFGIVLDLTHMASISDVQIDHCSTAGFATAGNGGGSGGGLTGPDQTFLKNVRITVGGTYGAAIDHGHSFHWDGGLIEFCAVGVRVASVNSAFFTNMDIEWNTGVGARIFNSRNVVFDKVTWETNGRGYADTSDEKCHLWVGTAAPSQVATFANFFHARDMRHLIRVDRGEYEDFGSYVSQALEPDAFVGGANSRVVYVTKAAGQAYVGGFGVSYPTGPNSNVSLSRPEAGRLRTRRGQYTESYGTAAPVEGTYNVGDTVANTSIAAGGVPGWVCTTAGTAGTLSVTGSIASGTSLLTLSSAANIGIGDYLTIAGVTGIKRVVSVSSGNDVTVHAAANATVAGAAVGYSAPVFKAMAAIAA